MYVRVDDHGIQAAGHLVEHEPLRLALRDDIRTKHRVILRSVFIAGRGPRAHP